MRKLNPLLISLALFVLLIGCATGPSIRYTDAMFEPEPAAAQDGVASWYHANWLGIGEQTASGERFHQYEMTAAHKTLPLGTFVRVVNLRNHRSTIARITDRGPYIAGRIVDLSKTGAADIGILDAGTAEVRLEVLIPCRVRMASLAGRGSQ
jgi:rare lipoprotein A